MSQVIPCYAVLSLGNLRAMLAQAELLAASGPHASLGDAACVVYGLTASTYPNVRADTGEAQVSFDSVRAVSGRKVSVSYHTPPA